MTKFFHAPFHLPFFFKIFAMSLFAMFVSPMSGFAQVNNTVTLTPTDMKIIAGETVQFTAVVKDKSGSVIVDPKIQWSVENPFIGTVTPGGLFEGRHLGSTNIIASVNGSKTQTLVTVSSPSKPIEIQLWPIGLEVISDEYSISADRSLDLEVKAIDRFGNQWTVKEGFELKSNNPGSRFIGNRFTPGGLGKFTISASLNDVKDMNTVTITKGKLSRIEVGLKKIQVTADERLDITATGYDADDHSWDITSSVVFSTNDPKGTIKSSVYHPGAVGEWKVFAALGSVEGSKTVNVQYGRLEQVDLRPNDMTMTRGETATFKVFAMDIDHNEWEVTDQAFFETNNGVIENHSFIPDFIGSVRVVASFEDFRDTSVLTIVNEKVSEPSLTAKTSLDSFEPVSPEPSKEPEKREHIQKLTDNVAASESSNEAEESLVSEQEESENEGKVLGVETVETTQQPSDQTPSPSEVVENEISPEETTPALPTTTAPKVQQTNNQSAPSASSLSAWVAVGIILSLGLIGVGVIGLIRRNG